MQFLIKLTSLSGPPLPCPDHPVDDLGQAVVALVDGPAQVPAAADLAAQDVVGQHLSLALHRYLAAFFHLVAALLQDLENKLETCS